MVSVRRAAEAIRADTRSGATALTARAGAALRAIAAEAEAAGRLDVPLLAAAARALVRAQPAMASICRLGDAVLAAVGDAPTAAEVAAAVTAFEEQSAADAAAVVARAVALVPDGGRLLTLSASSLVERAVLAAQNMGRRVHVVCLESRPGREGAVLAARLADAGVPTELWIDAAAARCVAGAQAVLVGADTVAPAGLVHKLGTLGLALAARQHGVPVYALAGATKLLPGLVDGALTQRRPASEIARGTHRNLRIENYYYDLTPLALLDGLVVGGDLCRPAQVAASAAAVGLHPLLAALLAS
jgi:translation initiation factor 2B subunit (eIF-2B alpha/beta/delta family)